MKINLSILGRLWTFDLAKQLQKRGYLNKLITSYPKFKTRKWNIPSNKVVSKLHLELITRIDDKTLKFYRDRHPFTHQSLARYAAKYMHECDIHIGWSGGSLEAIIKAKQLGKILYLRGGLHTITIKISYFKMKEINMAMVVGFLDIIYGKENCWNTN